MLWSMETCQNKVSADQYHVIILQAQVKSQSRSSVFFFKLITNQVLIFDCIMGSCKVNLLKTGPGCLEAS